MKKTFGFYRTAIFLRGALFMLAAFCSLPVAIKSQPMFSAAERRLIKERNYFSDAVRLHSETENSQPFALANRNQSPSVDGNLDATFNASVAEGFGYVRKTLVQPDGKILVVGLFQRANGVRVNNLARFNADGSLDASFNTGSGANAEIRAAALQPDGKIIVAGSFTVFNNQTVDRIIRLNADGSNDASFNVVSATGAQIYAVFIQPDGKILVGGARFNSNFNNLVRFNSDGSLDSAFVPVKNILVQTLALTADGKILVGGGNSVLRVNSDGTADASFSDSSNSSNGTIYKIVVQPDGKILVAGAFSSFKSRATDGLVRLNADGTVETSFDFVNNNPVTFIVVEAVALQPDGKILAGYYDDYRNYPAGLIRFTASGAVDQTFARGDAGEALVTDVSRFADGKVLIAGGFTAYNNQTRIRLARVNSDGTLDNAFAPSASTLGTVYAIKRQTDGKIVIGGDFGFVNGVRQSAIARLNADGTLDNAFQSGAGFNGYVFALLIQPDGKIMVGGLFGEYDNNFVGSLARINSNGSLDTSFNTNDNSYVFPVYALALQSDGKILAGGSVYDGNGNRRYLLRFNPDGKRDTTFNSGLTNGFVLAIAVQANNKILVGGNFFQQGLTYNRVGTARLNADGSLDDGFTTGCGFVNVLNQQPDGKIYAGGGCLVRYNSDAVAESILLNAASTSNLIRAIEIQPDGKIVIGGYLTNYNNVAVNNIARINPNGSLDTAFNAAASGQVHALSLQPDNKILAGGKFADFNNTEKFGLVRLQTLARRPATLYDFDGDAKADISVFRPSNGVWYLNRSSAGYTGLAFGLGTDNIAPADFDGDGKTDVAVFRPANGTWYLLRSQAGFTGVQFGQNGDIPVPADYDADGRADIAVFRPSNGTWYLLRSAQGFTAVQFGQNGDKPVAADYDADGKADVAVYRPSNGTWYLLRSQAGFVGTQFGDQADKPVAADYDGDGRADIAVFRSAVGVWYLLRSSQGFTGTQFGQAGDVPTASDYDGDGRADLSVFRPANGAWYRLNSQNNSFSATQFGANGDAPAPAAFVP